MSETISVTRTLLQNLVSYDDKVRLQAEQEARALLSAGHKSPIPEMIKVISLHCGRPVSYADALNVIESLVIKECRNLLSSEEKKVLSDLQQKGLMTQFDNPEIIRQLPE